MSRYSVLPLTLILAIVALAPAASPAAPDPGPTATAAKRCDVGTGRGYGTTYVRWIRTAHVGCARAKRVVRAFHACRQGARGRCHSSVKGFSCHENRSVGVGSFDSTVTCRRGAKRVKHGYTQWT
jgi:hypothetical protein